MMNKRIITCLDIKDGKVVKGINFAGIREIGDPIEYAVEYAKQGADELVLLNIVGTKSSKKNMKSLVEAIEKQISIPIVVGGGIDSLEDIEMYIGAGASKVSINTAAVKNPVLLTEGSNHFGKEKIILAIDGKFMGRGEYSVMIGRGRIDSGLDLAGWAKKGEELGAGEILLTSMDADGVKKGFDIDMTNIVCREVNIPVIASGGCGTVGHFIKVFTDTDCGAALAASIFHYRDLTVDTVKGALKDKGIPVNTDVKGGLKNGLI